MQIAHGLYYTTERQKKEKRGLCEEGLFAVMKRAHGITSGARSYSVRRAERQLAQVCYHITCSVGHQGRGNL